MDDPGVLVVEVGQSTQRILHIPPSHFGLQRPTDIEEALDAAAPQILAENEEQALLFVVDGKIEGRL